MGWSVVWRFVGLSSVNVDAILCPRCHLRNKSWRIRAPATLERCEKIPSSISMRSCNTGLSVVVAALQRGDALCASDLRAVLQRLGELKPWSEAAKSDNSLRSTLKQLGGQQATIELRQLLEDVAADDEQEKGD